MRIRTLNFRYQDHDIRVKLPKSYFKQNSKSYPLIVVQDGDFLFKDIEKEVIFVGIVSNERIREYTPWEAVVHNIKYEGEAESYVTWMTDELLPYLKKCFNISQHHSDIAIAGASFGGLVSLYTIFKKTNVFGTYILISPSVWYPNFINFMRKQESIDTEKHIYWYVGALEGTHSTELTRNMFTDTEHGVDILDELLYSEKTTFQFIINRKGLHRKPIFKKHFKRAVQKLF